ncbi:HNH endonuclease [Nocardia asiatica]|uniref:HNH endonuclease n=1 Tax=Nocardia asiatica TaxID=209252 RepID=UPI003EE40BC8
MARANSPLTVGGPNDVTNLQLLCRDCNGAESTSARPWRNLLALLWTTQNYMLVATNQRTPESASPRLRIIRVPCGRRCESCQPDERESPLTEVGGAFFMVGPRGVGGTWAGKCCRSSCRQPVRRDVRMRVAR